jgi:hypothetical protein
LAGLSVIASDSWLAVLSAGGLPVVESILDVVDLSDVVSDGWTSCKVGDFVIRFIASTNLVPTQVPTSPPTNSTNKSRETYGMDALASTYSSSGVE